MLVYYWDLKLPVGFDANCRASDFSYSNSRQLIARVLNYMHIQMTKKSIILYSLSWEVISTEAVRDKQKQYKTSSDSDAFKMIVKLFLLPNIYIPVLMKSQMFSWKLCGNEFNRQIHGGRFYTLKLLLSKGTCLQCCEHVAQHVLRKNPQGGSSWICNISPVVHASQ